MATFTVTNRNNAGAGSLRQAVLDANALANVGGVADIISFDAAILNGPSILVLSQIIVTEGLTINGPGADKLTLSGGGTSRLFNFQTGASTVSGLTLTQGNNGGTSGGAIQTSGLVNLVLDGVAITNSSGFTGGAVANGGSTLTIRNSYFASNTANIRSGAVDGATSISNSTFSGNSAPDGGAVSLAFNASVASSTFVGNTATTNGAGIYGNGGGTAQIINSVFADNTAPATPDIFIGTGTATVSYSLLKGGANGLATLGAGTISGGAAATYTPGAVTLVGGLGVYIPTVGSLVINAGDPAYTIATTPLTDERGFVRVVGGAIDMGAAEFGSALPLIVIPAAPPVPAVQTPAPPPTVAPMINANFSGVLGTLGFGVNAPPATVTTPTGQVLPNPLLEQQKATNVLIARVDAGTLTLKAAQDIIVDMADATTSVATMGYQFFTGKLPTKEGLAFLVSSPENPTDLNDGFYAGMSAENRYINFAVNLAKPPGPGVNFFQTAYGSLSLTDATAKAYAEIFGKAADAAKIGAILTPERSSYLATLGGDAIGQKAAMVGWLLGEAAKSDIGPYAARNENFLYDLLDGTAAFGADAHVYDNAGPITVGLVGVV